MKFFIRILAIGIFFISAQVAFAATITVDTTNPTAMPDGSCSLSEAIANANGNNDGSGGDCISGEALPTIDRIEFAISGAGPHTITTSSQFNIEEAVTIDGATQTGTVCTLEGGIRELKINIDASGINGNLNIFNIGNENDLVDDVTIKGLALYGNEYGSAITTWSNETVIQCNNIGTDTLGLTAYPNSNGIVMYDNDTNIARTGIVIGGPNPGDGNLISGNGILDNNDDFDGWGIIGAGQGVIIQGNWIGLDITGQSGLGNLNAGITFGNGTVVEYNNLQILDNVISGNGILDASYSPGINIGGSDETGVYEPVTDLVIKGNIIGLSADGLVDLGNENDGIGIFAEAVGVTIGGPLEVERNIISGNGGNGISIGYDVENVTIQGNYIGTDITGENGLGNDSIGIGISDGDRAQIITNILIGGDIEAEGNIISGNTNSGIYVDGDSITISGNKIGTDPTGLVCIGNGNQGIQNSVLTTNLLIGGGTAGERNIVGCAVNGGLYLQGPATVQGNYIGVGADGETDIATPLNDDMDIGIDFLAESIIGGDTSEKGNIIRYLTIGIKATTPTGSSLIQNNTIIEDIQGIQILSMTDNLEPVVTILQNSITNNFQIGIDLANDSDDDYNADGVGASVQNINDLNDTDTGPNGYLNHPVVLMTLQDGSDTRVLYGLDVPIGTYRIEFFTNPTNGVSSTGYGEGEIYEDFAMVSKTTEGFETFTKVLTNTDLDDDVTATTTLCTDANCTDFLGTSEFSNTAPPGVDYDSTDYTASHVLNTIYLGACVNGDNGDSTNTDTMGPNQVGAYLGTGPCTDDRDGVDFGSSTSGGVTPSSISAVSLLSQGGDFSGALNDMTTSGTYTGTDNVTVLILIYSVSPGNSDDADYFMPVFNIGSDYFPGSPTKITPGVSQLIGDGISIMFESGTGHTAFDNGSGSGPVLVFSLTPEHEAFTFTENTGTFLPSATVAVQTTASANGYVHAWLDSNNDGDFLDTGEHVVISEAILSGEDVVNFVGPSQDGTYPVRVRYISYEDIDLGPTGLANDGEVEDYSITVATPVIVVPVVGGAIVHFGKVCNDTKASNFTNGPGYGDVSVCVYTLQKSSQTNTTTIGQKVSAYNFTRTLRLGMKGEDVRQLQIYLNTHGYPVSTSGAGSLGKETTYFGKATMQALIRFQEGTMASILKSLGLTKGTGVFGPATMKVVK